MLETVVLQVTTKCPYHCPQCYMKRGAQDMPIDIAKGVIDVALAKGARAVQITGGEPLAYPHIFDVIQYASERGLMTLLATSGYRCSDETYARLKACGLTALCASVNGISEVTNRLSRDSFAESLGAIRTAVRHEMLCFLNVVVTDDNVGELQAIGEYAESCGVVGINILRPVRSYDGGYVPRVSARTLTRLAEIVNASPELFRVEGCYKEYWEHVTGEKFSCRDLGKTTYFVNVDGTVSPCSKTTGHKYPSFEQMLTQISEWGCGCL